MHTSSPPPGARRHLLKIFGKAKYKDKLLERMSELFITLIYF